jgi:hypothetical protein
MAQNSQLSLFPYTPVFSGISYRDVQTVIEGFLSEKPDCAENTEFKLNQDNLAISFFDQGGSSRSLWVKLGKTFGRLEIKPSYCLLIDSLIDLKPKLKQLSNGRYALPFDDMRELASCKNIVLDIYDYRERKAKGRLFDCCSRYMACSDARNCVHPSKEFSLSCSYRRAIKQGVIFYGVNRNV